MSGQLTLMAMFGTLEVRSWFEASKSFANEIQR